MSQENTIQCPTAISAVLLRLYAYENIGPDDLDAISLVNWWAQKVDDPESSDDWLTGRLWRLYARHLHAWVVINEPGAADVAAYIMGIDNPLIPQPQMVRTEDGQVYERWELENYHNSLPPHGFDTWQKPIRLQQPISLPADSESPLRYTIERQRRFWNRSWKSRREQAEA